MDSVEKVKLEKWNVGISILRIWMCYAIVISHGYHWDQTESNPIVLLVQYSASYGVPCYMMMSFLMTDIYITANDNSLIIKRMGRLLIPHFFFSIASFIMYYVLYFISGQSNYMLSINQLLLQLILGHSYNSTLQFIVTMIYVTLLLIFIMRIPVCKKSYIRNCLMITLLCFSLFMQYSGLNWKLFGTLPYELKYPLGRFFEMVPYAVIGCLLFQLIPQMREHNYFTILFCSITVILLHWITVIEKPGFSYSGIGTIKLVVFIVLFFFLIPFTFFPHRLKIIINELAKYMMCIYAIHYPIGTLVHFFFPSYDQTQLSSRSLIFLICLFIAYLGSKIPNKTLRKAFV